MLMFKCLKTLLICSILCLTTSLVCFGAVYPTVDFAFDASTYEYSWTVSFPADSTYSFSQLWVLASLPLESLLNPNGPWVGDVNQEWTATYPPIDDPGGPFAIRWQAGVGQTVYPGSAWVGTFKITVPNSVPVPGQAQTSGGIQGRNLVDTYVPQIIPEPASVASLCVMLAGLAPVALRRKK